MHLINLLKKYAEEKTVVCLTFGENFSMNCQVLEVCADFIRINQLSFNKAEKAFNPTPHFYIVPIGSIVFLEEPRQK